MSKNEAPTPSLRQELGVLCLRGTIDESPKIPSVHTFDCRLQADLVGGIRFEVQAQPLGQDVVCIL